MGLEVAGAVVGFRKGEEVGGMEGSREGILVGFREGEIVGADEVGTREGQDDGNSVEGVAVGIFGVGR